ncbi:uncharacterized protein LOC107992139 [Cucumis melo]|uniref:Uncharacterized protein LOC107992139 n=1 Tax=Cucumis melo TaxID=3656 RepID=A0ABM3L2A6_CUCME|nr:uncharacterized protein LOC107992139 [Cucumis melo]
MAQEEISQGRSLRKKEEEVQRCMLKKTRSLKHKLLCSSLRTSLVFLLILSYTNRIKREDRADCFHAKSEDLWFFSTSRCTGGVRIYIWDKLKGSWYTRLLEWFCFDGYLSYTQGIRISCLEGNEVSSRMQTRSNYPLWSKAKRYLWLSGDFKTERGRDRRSENLNISKDVDGGW